MIDIKRILCPVDFSDFSRRALDYAIGIARWYDARVTALHVASVAAPVAVGAGPPVVMSSVDHARLRADLEAFADAERAEGVAVDVEVAEGQTWYEIAERARNAEADLLVLGTHGRSGFERLLLGSVTEKLLRTAPCPTLTVPRAAADAVPIAPGLFKCILCATDFSPASERAMSWAASLALEADAKLFVLHVFEHGVAPDEEAFPKSALAALRHDYQKWCAERLHDAVPAAAREGCTVEELTGAGRPHREILRIASEKACDLIVMGVGGHRGVGDRLFGSTTQHVVRAAACPVLTIRTS